MGAYSGSQRSFPTRAQAPDARGRSRSGPGRRRGSPELRAARSAIGGLPPTGVISLGANPTGSVAPTAREPSAVAKRHRDILLHAGVGRADRPRHRIADRGSGANAAPHGFCNGCGHTPGVPGQARPAGVRGGMADASRRRPGHSLPLPSSSPRNRRAFQRSWDDRFVLRRAGRMKAWSCSGGCKGLHRRPVSGLRDPRGVPGPGRQQRGVGGVRRRPGDFESMAGLDRPMNPLPRARDPPKFRWVADADGAPTTFGAGPGPRHTDPDAVPGAVSATVTSPGSAGVPRFDDRGAHELATVQARVARMGTLPAR